MMKENNGSARKKVKPRSEAFLVSPEETKSVSSLARNRSRVRRVVYIDKPVSWSGGAFWSLLIVLLHYMIFAFLFLTGLYHNYSEPPVQLALIPSFTAGCVSVFGILCIPLQANKYIRFLLRPSSGMLLSVAAMIGAGVWSAMLYGPLQKNFSQAFQYLESSGAGVIYLLLVYRRLKFADSAFSAGAESLLRVRSIFVRACVHALLHILYIVLWSFCYINLIEVKDVSSTSNATKTANPFPQWSTGGGTYVTFGSPSLWVAKTFLLYNLYSVTMMVKTLKCMSASLIHTQIKSSLWISIWSISSKLSEAARNQSEVVLLSDYQEKLYFRKKLPTILMASQFLIISQILNSFTEAFRRSSRVRSGALYHFGAFASFFTNRISKRYNFFGLSFDEADGKHFVRKSQEVWELMGRTGMRDVVNSDLLFGARLLNLVFLGTACSIAGTLLVQISGYPFAVAEHMGWFCFVTGIAAGNWAMECAEMWACSLFLEFAHDPSSVYISNPEFAEDVFEVLFGVGAQKKDVPGEQETRDLLNSDRSTVADAEE